MFVYMFIGFISPSTTRSPNLHGGALGGIVASGVVFVLIMVAASIILGYYWQSKKHKRIHKIYTSRQGMCLRMHEYKYSLHRLIKLLQIMYPVAKTAGISLSTFYTNEYVNTRDEVWLLNDLKF